MKGVSESKALKFKDAFCGRLSPHNGNLETISGPLLPAYGAKLHEDANTLLPSKKVIRSVLQSVVLSLPEEARINFSWYLLGA